MNRSLGTNRSFGIYLFAFVGLFLIGSFSNLAVAEPAKDKTIKQVEKNFKKSLHATRAGKPQYYEAHHGGFETLTGVRYKDLACKNCHAATLADGTPVEDATYKPSCADCHKDPTKPTDNPVTNDTCLGCHSRQGVELMFFSNCDGNDPDPLTCVDVHRKEGFTMCTDCHKSTEIHGDVKKKHRSMQEMGAIEANCTNCHTEEWLETQHPEVVTRYHAEHVDCSACHVKSVIACESCHFESELEGIKRFYGPPPHRDFRLLVQKDGKVHSATYQSLTYQGTSFYVIAPYVAHSIIKEGIKCGDCHRTNDGGNAAVNEYVESGKITVTEWDGEKLIGPQGVVPVPPGWQEVLQFDFMTYTGEPTDLPVPFDPTKWIPQVGPATMTQMPFGEPLSEEQMDALANALVDQ